jgi:hypothetical protein
MSQRHPRTFDRAKTGRDRHSGNRKGQTKGSESSSRRRMVSPRHQGCDQEERTSHGETETTSLRRGQSS